MPIAVGLTTDIATASGETATMVIHAENSTAPISEVNIVDIERRNRYNRSEYQRGAGRTERPKHPSLSAWSCFDGRRHLTAPQLQAELSGGGGANGIQLDGDAKLLDTIISLTDQPDTAFAIVTP